MDMSTQNNGSRFAHLRALLERLLDSLPTWNGIDFRTWSPSSEEETDYGIPGAVTRQLELAFKYKNGALGNGPIDLDHQESFKMGQIKGVWEPLGTP
jgi:hypothetical protein